VCKQLVAKRNRIDSVLKSKVERNGKGKRGNKKDLKTIITYESNFGRRGLTGSK